MQVHLLDATYELFRAHFGRPPHADADGRPVAATLGVVESVLSLLREDGVTHIGCATDHVIRSWRNERYAGYKTEAGMPPELLAQFGLVEDALRALGLVVWPMVEFEADDGLAAAAARFAEHPLVERVVILSPDKDMAQCVRQDGRVLTFDRRAGRFMDAAGVEARFGVSPASIPDYLALVGDSADGYPGLPGARRRTPLPRAGDPAPRCADPAARSRRAALARAAATGLRGPGRASARATPAGAPWTRALTRVVPWLQA